MVKQGYATVDRKKCFSYAVCVDIMPDTFYLDDEGISVVTLNTSGELRVLVEVAEACPMQAISVFPSESFPA